MRKRLLITIILVFISIATYFIFNGKNEVSAQQSQTTSEFVCRYNDQNLCKFIQKFSENKSYFLPYEPGLQTTVDTLGNTTVSILETDGKNLQITRIKNKKEFAKIIIGNGILYKKDFVTNTWEKHAITQEKINQFALSYYVDTANAFTSQTDEYQRLSNEDCESRQCFRYKVIFAVKPTDINSMFIYFDDEEYLLRKVLIQYKGGSQDEFIPYYTYTSI